MANEAEGLQLSQTISGRCGADRREDDVILLRSSSGDKGTRENHLHVPPMHFPHDTLVIMFDPPADGERKEEALVQTRLEFNVLDALSCWAVQHRAEEHSAFIPEVPYARKWAPQETSEKQDLMSSDVSTMKSDESNKNSEGFFSDVGVVQFQEWDWTYRLLLFMIILR